MARTQTPPASQARAEAAGGRATRARLSQEDVPGYSLDQALRVARAIADSYAYKPTRPMNVAGAMKMSPGSGPFRGITGASIAYGLTTGGAFAPEIGITPLGMRIVRPTQEGDELAAKREALLKPKVVGEFLRQYDAAPLPTDQIAKNVLLEKGVPRERLDDVLSLILDGAAAVGFLSEISGRQYVDLTGTSPASAEESGGEAAGPVRATPQPMAAAPTAAPAVSMSPGVHVNIEIHIAADATSQTIEDIFRNMRRYVLSGDGTAEEE